MTRLEAMTESRQAILLPPNPAEYLTDWLFDIGPSAGDRSIGYTDLAAWQAISGVKLEPWEARTLRRLSGEYLGQMAKSRKAGSPPPYAGERQEARDKVTSQFAAMMNAAKARAQPKKAS